MYVLPRGYDFSVSTSVIFTNEETSSETTIFPVSIGTIGNNLEIDLKVPDFTEGQRYTFEVWQDEVSLIYRGVAFVTEFKNDNYTINNNEFVIDTSTDSDSIKVYE